ncbi:hypothetical protein F5B17DRAFT_398706 [Nemania serpens]|nr:hypothetical protein F5B17DRAFT_398706 [Nemania serpens]
MRPSSFFGVLAAVAYSRPIKPFNDSLLDNLRDLIFGNVGGLFSYPYGLYSQASCFAHNFESKLCVAQCVPDCMGEAQEVCTKGRVDCSVLLPVTSYPRV